MHLRAGDFAYTLHPVAKLVLAGSGAGAAQ